MTDTQKLAMELTARIIERQLLNPEIELSDLGRTAAVLYTAIYEKLLANQTAEPEI